MKLLIIDIRSDELQKCDLKECRYNILCMKNYQKKYPTIISLMLLIKYISISCWNLFSINIIFPEEIKTLIFKTYLNVLQQAMPPEYSVIHCSFKKFCHDTAEFLLAQRGATKCLSGDFCKKCGKEYCNDCSEQWHRTNQCNLCISY